MKKVIAAAVCLVIMCVLLVGCDSGEECRHDYNAEYVCSKCGEKKECTLEIIGQDYADEMMKIAKVKAGDLTGNFEIVVLGKEDTVENLKNYIITPTVDTEDITGGLFVKLDVTMGGKDVLFTVYYNFALQFGKKQAEPLTFTYEGSEETWTLDVIKGNKTILFESAIANE